MCRTNLRNNSWARGVGMKEASELRNIRADILPNLNQWQGDCIYPQAERFHRIY